MLNVYAGRTEYPLHECTLTLFCLHGRELHPLTDPGNQRA
jgi:hypothetical protein